MFVNKQDDATIAVNIGHLFKEFASTIMSFTFPLRRFLWRNRNKCLIPKRFEHSTQIKTNHFGFKQVSDEEKFEKGNCLRSKYLYFFKRLITFCLVQQVFSNVASKYDLMNDVMSLGIHRYWKKNFIELLDPYPGTRLLDVAGGTGDIAFEFLRYTSSRGDNESSVVVCDINQDMIKYGQKRAQEQGVDTSKLEWVHGNALELPFEDNSFDAFTIAFGIRNVVHVDKAVAEAFRVVKPGGIFQCLEFSQVNNVLFRR